MMRDPNSIDLYTYPKSHLNVINVSHAVSTGFISQENVYFHFNHFG